VSSDGAHREAADGQNEEALHRCGGAERAGHHRRNGEAKEHQTAGVVEQALAFQQDLQPPRQLHPLQHGTRGNGVGRRNDGAQRGAGRPRQCGKERMGHQRDDQGREEHRADRERDDADQVPAQMPKRDEPRAVHQQRRQEDDQDQARIERHGGQAREEGEQHAAGEQRH
jgi:hypothetical protein